MKVSQTTIPEQSLLNKENQKFDYADSYQGAFKDLNHSMGPEQVAKAFFNSSSNWTRLLFSARNKIVKLFGLKTGGSRIDRKKQLQHFKFEKGEKLGLFKIYEKTDTEMIMGEDDKHLNFRVSLLLEEKENDPGCRTLTITTVVVFNNWAGRLYFLPVKPFHRLMVPALLKRIITELDK